MCGIQLVMAGISVMQGIQQRRNANAQARYERGVGEYNARVAENEAQETRSKANEEENLQRRKTAELLSKQRAQLGAANVDIGSGSALQLQDDTVALGEADALRIRSNYDSKVNSLNSKAGLTKSDSEMRAVAAKNQGKAALLSGATGVLSSGVAGKWFTPSSAKNVNLVGPVNNGSRFAGYA